MSHTKSAIGDNITPLYALLELSPTTYKVYSLIILQMKKSRVKAETVEISFTQIRQKTMLSYTTITKCVRELEEYPELIEVIRKNGNTMVYKPNMDCVL